MLCYECRDLKHIRLGTYSSLEVMCAESFYGARLRGVRIPDCVCELGARCCCLIVTLFHISDLGYAQVLSVSEWRHFRESCEVAPLKLLAFQMA